MAIVTGSAVWASGTSSVCACPDRYGENSPNANAPTIVQSIVFVIHAWYASPRHEVCAGSHEMVTCLVEDWRSADTVRGDILVVPFILGQRRHRRLPDVRGGDRGGVLDADRADAAGRDDGGGRVGEAAAAQRAVSRARDLGIRLCPPPEQRACLAG